MSGVSYFKTHGNLKKKKVNIWILHVQQSSVVFDSTFNIVTENFLSFRFTVTILYRLKWSFPPIFFRYYILIDWLKVQQSNDNSCRFVSPKESLT